MFEHPQKEEVLEEVRALRLAGKTIPQISHSLARKFKPPGKEKRTNKLTWYSHHVLECIEALRARGDLPPSKIIIQGAEQYHRGLQMLSDQGRMPKISPR